MPIGRPRIPGVRRIAIRLREADLEAARKVGAQTGRPYQVVVRDWLSEAAGASAGRGALGKCLGNDGGGRPAPLPSGFRRFKVCWTGADGSDRCREVVAENKKRALDRIAAQAKLPWRNDDEFTIEEVK